ncbi:SGNH/GDSL hydrolase family protein [soil metagenome]
MTSLVRRDLVAGLLLSTLASASCTRADPPNPQFPAGPTASVAPDAGEAPPPPLVRFVGRFDTHDPAGVRFAWPGSTVGARFKGTAVAVRLKDDGRNFFQVLVDGEPKAVLHTDAHKEIYPLAEGLPDGVHDVAIYRRTEPKLGETTFLGFETAGTLLPPPPAPERRIELIGDSITAGYGNEGPNATCTFNPAEENQYQTYGAIAARALNAEHVTIAWSAQTIGQMTEYFERTLPARTDSQWDFKAWVPQVVVLNVGTNNFATYDPTEVRYVRIYQALFDRVRKVYPTALIVCLLGPMLTDIYPPGKKNLTLARKYMAATMAKIKDSGEKNFEYVELPEQNHANGLGCGFHPSLKTHKLMADRVVQVIHERLGW